MCEGSHDRAIRGFTAEARRNVAVEVVDSRYRCLHCDGDRRMERFVFFGRKRIGGCCRALVARVAMVLPEQVIEFSVVVFVGRSVPPVDTPPRTPSLEEIASSPRHWRGLWL